MTIAFLRTDEERDAVCSLEMVAEQLPKVIYDPHRWKWVIISLHNAMQGYMVLALKGSNSLNVLSKDSCAEWLAAYENPQSSPPRLKIDDFMHLYKKIKLGRGLYDKEIKLGCKLPGRNSDLMLMYSDSIPFKPAGTQTQSVKMLHHLRNDFVHFLPKGWSIEMIGLPMMVRDCVDIIEFLAFKCGNVMWYVENLKTETRDLIERIRVQTAAITAFYET